MIKPIFRLAKFILIDGAVRASRLVPIGGSAR
jgi:hypothetical protein